MEGLRTTTPDIKQHKVGAHGFSRLCAYFFEGRSPPTSPSKGSKTAKKSMDLSKSSWISGIPRGKNPQKYLSLTSNHELHFSQKIIKNARRSSEIGSLQQHRQIGGVPLPVYFGIRKSGSSFVWRLMCLYLRIDQISASRMCFAT